MTGFWTMVFWADLGMPFGNNVKSINRTCESKYLTFRKTDTTVCCHLRQVIFCQQERNTSFNPKLFYSKHLHKNAITMTSHSHPSKGWNFSSTQKTWQLRSDSPDKYHESVKHYRNHLTSSVLAVPVKEWECWGAKKTCSITWQTQPSQSFWTWLNFLYSAHKESLKPHSWAEEASLSSALPSVSSAAV